MRPARILCLGVSCVLMTLGAAAASAAGQAQDQKVSLGEAARRLRQHRKPGPAPAKVWTNDDIPKLPEFGVNVVGPLPESLTEDRESKPASTGAPSDQDLQKQRTDVEGALNEEKAHFSLVSQQLDLLQREQTLDQQQFYSNPGYTNDVQGKARLDDRQQQIAAKQQEIQQSKDKIADLEAKLAKLKAASPAIPPTAPSPPQPQEP